MAVMNVNAADAMQNVTLTFTLTRTYRIRMWLAVGLIRLAGLALGSSVVVVLIDGEGTNEAGA